MVAVLPYKTAVSSKCTGNCEQKEDMDESMLERMEPAADNQKHDADSSNQRLEVNSEHDIGARSQDAQHPSFVTDSRRYGGERNPVKERHHRLPPRRNSQCVRPLSEGSQGIESRSGHTMALIVQGHVHELG